MSLEDTIAQWAQIYALVEAGHLLSEDQASDLLAEAERLRGKERVGNCRECGMHPDSPHNCPNSWCTYPKKARGA